jgi:adenosylmethionine-8-amino-7-oxononanoate aminotransferase
MKAALSDEVAAFIFEPLVQGAAGMIMYEPVFLDELMGLCQHYDVITIADEVMTGFGRTGKMFATDYCKANPDIICLSKGLTGGFMPLGATLCIEPIYSAYLTDDRTKTFFHGHSYTANPLACAAAIASLDLFEKEQTLARAGFIAGYFEEQCERFSEHPAVKEARCRGAILALEIRTKEETNYLNPLADRVHGFFQERGIILRPLGNVLYVLPPYCIEEEKQLDKVMNAIEAFLATC